MDKRYKYVINGFLAFLFLGVSYAWSIFVIPLELYYGWHRSVTSLAFTLNLFFCTLGSVFVGILSYKFKFKILLRMAAIMIGMGFFLTSLANQAWQIYITYSFFCGFGIGIGYNCILSSVPEWFPEKRGTINGILLTGYALSTAVLGPIINLCIKNYNIIITFRILSILCMSGLLLTSLFLDVPSLEELRQLPQQKIRNKKTNNNVITYEMIKKPIFYVYYLLCILAFGIGLSYINHASPVLTESLKLDSTIASLVISVGSIFNGVGRLVFGKLYDNYGTKQMLCVVSWLLLGSVSVLALTLTISKPSIFVIATFLLLFSFGGNASLIPNIIRDLFGSRTFSLNYSIFNTNTIIQSIFPTFICFLQVNTGNYYIPFYVLLVLSIFVVLLMITFNHLYSIKQ